MGNSSSKKMTGIKSFEDLLVSLAIEFVNVPPKELNQKIACALQMTGEFTGVDRAYIFSYDFERQVTSNTYEWCAKGIEPMLEFLQDVPLEGLEDWMGAHLKGDAMHVPWVEDLPTASILRSILEPQGIKTLVTIPLMYDSKCLGFVGLDAVRQRKIWLPEELILLQMLAELFTNAEIGKRRVNALEQAEQKAVSTERLLCSAVEASKVAIWETNEKSGLVHCAAGWASLLGEDFDNTWTSLAALYARVHPKDRRRVFKDVTREGKSSGEPLQVSFRLWHRENRWVDVLARGFYEFDSGGQLLRIYGSTVEVTEVLLEAERAKKRLEMDHTRLLISSRFVGASCDDFAVNLALQDAGGFSGAGRAYLMFLDRDRQEMSNTHEWCAPGVRSELAARKNLPFSFFGDLVSRLERGEAVLSQDIPSMGLSEELLEILGQQGIFSMVLVPLMVGGLLEGVLGFDSTTCSCAWTPVDLSILRSVAEIIAGALSRNRAELELRRSEAFHRSLLNSLRDAVFMTDGAGRINFVNQSWNDVTGIADHFAIGLMVPDLLKLMGQQEEGYKLNFLTGSVIDGKSVIRLGTSEEDSRWLSLRQFPLNSPSHLKGTLGMISDVTDEWRREEQMLLARIKAESKKKATTLDLSTLSHELRTPMHGVIGMLELMMEPKIPEARLHAYANNARSSAISLLRLLDDILDTVKFERGLIKLEEKRVDLKAITEGLVVVFKAEASKKSISLGCQIGASFPTIFLTDELRFRQILGNLLKNAVTYTHTGSISVRLSWQLPYAAWELEPSQGVICLEVVDTGIDIEAQHLATVFEPFVQLGESSHHHAGSGLGLAIVHEIIELMKGRIRIDSKLGEGTTVRVELPLTLGASEKSLAFSNDGLQELQEGFKGFRVLVAEDNEINRILACEHLERLGCEVSHVVNGLEAVAACEQEFYHLVIMDCQMPVMNGFEASAKILANPAVTRLPIIVGCSANASDEVTVMCLAAGMRAVISKPFSLPQLAFELKPLLTGLKSEVARPESPQVLAQPVFDPEVLRSLDAQAGGDGMISSRLIGIFREESQRQMDATRTALRNGDFGRMTRAAHALKGNAAALGLNALAELCGHLSDSAPTRGWRGEIDVGYIQFGERLLVEYEKAVEALDSTIDQTSHARHRLMNGGEGSPFRVLVAEDSNANFAIAEMFLEKAGYVVSRAADGRQAVAAARDEDLILMDIEMPDMDGLEAIQLIRQAEREEGRTAVPILVLTAYAIQDYRERGMASGCTGFITKPVRRDELIEAVGVALAETRSIHKSSQPTMNHPQDP
jgi:PAS domain S-box-containing protein